MISTNTVLSIVMNIVDFTYVLVEILSYILVSECGIDPYILITPFRTFSNRQTTSYNANILNNL